MQTVPNKWATADAHNFYLEQLKIVRAEADKLSDETRVIERYVVGGCGAIYTFVVANPKFFDGHSRFWICLIPLLLVVWGGLRSVALFFRIRQCGRYVRGAEKILQIEGWKGWEHWLNSPEENEHYILISAILIWFLLLIGTAFISINRLCNWNQPVITVTQPTAVQTAPQRTTKPQTKSA